MPWRRATSSAIMNLMYCPVCFQNTLKIRSNGVVKLSFNAKSRNNSLFTYNLQKDSAEDLNKKLKEKIFEFFAWYDGFQNKPPIKSMEIFSGDFQCTNSCKIDILNTRVNLIGVLFQYKEVKKLMEDEAKKFGIIVELPNDT